MNRTLGTELRSASDDRNFPFPSSGHRVPLLFAAGPAMKRSNSFVNLELILPLESFRFTTNVRVSSDEEMPRPDEGAFHRRFQSADETHSRILGDYGIPILIDFTLSWLNPETSLQLK
uniref:Neur_chan_LBD domain-containing protein n=1 Tax=Steinernema glaseri TaxID=37863 RepID=A0A1I7YVR9_9BILA